MSQPEAGVLSAGNPVTEAVALRKATLAERVAEILKSPSFIAYSLQHAPIVTAAERRLSERISKGVAQVPVARNTLARRFRKNVRRPISKTNPVDSEKLEREFRKNFSKKPLAGLFYKTQQSLGVIQGEFVRSDISVQVYQSGELTVQALDGKQILSALAIVQGWQALIDQRIKDGLDIKGLKVTGAGSLVVISAADLDELEKLISHLEEGGLDLVSEPSSALEPS